MKTTSRTAAVGLALILSGALTLTATQAKAAPVEVVSFSVSGLVTTGGGTFFDGLTTATVTFSYDEAATPTNTLTLSSFTRYDFPYLSFSMTAGGQTFTAVSTAIANDEIRVTDNNTGDDEFKITSGTNVDIGGGFEQDLLQFAALGNSGVLSTLGDLGGGFVPNLFKLQVLDTSESKFSILQSGNDTVFTEINAIPVPAAFSLLLTALGGLGLARWRRRRMAA